MTAGWAATRISLRSSPATATTRNGAVDALKGIAMILVVLSHSWKVWPVERRWPLGSLEALFSAGSVAVSAFFAVTGFLVVRSFCEGYDAGGALLTMHRFVRRTIRLWLPLALVLACVWLVSLLDPTDTTKPGSTRRSVLAAATFTWNTYVRDHVFEARSDIGAFYFLSIDLQVVTFLALAVIILRRYRLALLVVIGAGVFLSSFWRWTVFAEHGWYYASLTTSARMDAILWGALSALVLERIRTRFTNFIELSGAALLILLGAVVSCAFVDIAGYFGPQGVVTAAAAAIATAALLSVPGQAPRTFGERALAWPPLVRVGRASLPIFLWHIPVFEFVARHTPTLHPLPRSIVAAALLAVLVGATRRWIIAPVDRLTRPRPVRA